MAKLPVLSLIIANTAPIIGIIFFGWEWQLMLWLYWFENIIIGGYNLLKIITASPYNSLKTIGLLLFFTIHYTMFVAFHGIFLKTLISDELTFNSTMLTAVSLLVASHGISFITNFIGKKEYQKITVEQLLTAPYSRIIIMQVVTVIGTMLFIATGINSAFLIILIITKIIIDLQTHRKAHRQLKKLKIPATPYISYPR